jgi:NAD(P)-dependent dehydrogenase (short-subunit alcohol dehydrogenase family)
MGELAGKVAIVTGAAGGMGRAMAVALLDAGARVLAFDLSGDALADLANNAPDAVKVFPGDVASPADCKGAVAAAAAKWGSVDILVNNAGVGMAFIRPDNLQNPIRFWEVPVDRWQSLMDINVRGPFVMAHEATPHMIAKGWGRIINVTTSLDTMYRRAYTPYGSSKAALEAASASWAADLQGTGVTVNVLIPGGAVNTAFFDATAPLKRETLIQPQVMVPPMLWLASRAADAITGMRFVACNWDANKPAETAARDAGALAAWPGIGAGSQWPDQRFAPAAKQ